MAHPQITAPILGASRPEQLAATLAAAQVTLDPALKARLDALTGLAEYRNGGLLVDTGVIVPRDPATFAVPSAPGAEPIVEWRALTVALIDALAPRVRARLGATAATMPLAAVLEGGTWAAGRDLAQGARDGEPPFAIASDGTVF